MNTLNQSTKANISGLYATGYTYEEISRCLDIPFDVVHHFIWTGAYPDVRLPCSHPYCAGNAVHYIEGRHYCQFHAI